MTPQHHASQLTRLHHLVSDATIDAIARKHGWCERRRKITPVAFLQSCCLLTVYTAHSLSAWATLLGWLIHDTVSKQALSKKLTHASVRLVRDVLFTALSETAGLQPRIAGGAFAAFRRVLLHDSTAVALPARLAAVFPGSGNQHRRTATLKIQTIYDALSERFVRFRLTPFRQNDQSTAADILAVLQPGDLVLRDLGYFCLAVFRRIDAGRACFLTRFPHGLSVCRQDGAPLDLLTTLRRTGSLDTRVYAGTEERVPMRLVAIPIPKAVADARRRTARANRNRSTRPTSRHLALLEWEIFLTNVSESVWTTAQVGQIYGVRWRIEIIFKAWKQHFSLTQFTTASQQQVELLMLARLLFITLFQVTIFRHWSRVIKARTGRDLSLLKVTQCVSCHFWMFVLATTSSEAAALFEAQVEYQCCYERRRRPNYHEIMLTLSLS